MSASQAGLFAEPSIGPWLPDEIVFSLASRHHRLSGNHSHETTCLQLFGHRRMGCAHDFPCRIDELARRVDGVLGDAPSIIRDHTILPYYLPLRSRDAARSAIAAMRGPSIGSLKFTLGLLTSRFRAHHPLKACPDCMLEDREQWRVAYWHRAHQLPGYWICTKHRQLLLECDVKSTGVGRFGWVLPDRGNLRLRVTAAAGLDETLTALSQAAEGLCCLDAGALDAGHLRQIHLTALHQLGLATSSGRLRARKVAQAYLAYSLPLRAIPELVSLPLTTHEAEAQVRRLLYPARSGTHPIRHLLLIVWLHGSWSAFLNRYRDAQTGSSVLSKPSGAHPRSPNETSKRRVLSLVAHEGRSVSGAAQEVGVDYATAAAWVAQRGHTIARRPKALRGAARRRVSGLLKRGLDVPAVAATSGFSQSTIHRMLSSEPGLYAAWKDAKWRQARKAAREAWVESRGAHPLSGVKVWRALAPAAYAWLYRNEPAWLQSQSKGPRPASFRSPAVNWDERDLAISAAVRRVALMIRSLQSGARVTLGQLCQEMPELKAKLGCLDRLPLTRTALFDVRRR